MTTGFLDTLEQAHEPQVVKVAAARTLFGRGDIVRWFHVVRAGRIRLSRVLRHGTQITLARVSVGGILAEASIWAGRYHCDAVAEVECELHRFRIGDVRSLLAREPKAADTYGHYLARQVMDLRAIGEIRGIRRADERLLAWLRLRTDGPTFESPGSWASVANELGLTSESIYRALARLVLNRQIVRRGNRVVVINVSDAKRPVL